MKNFKDYLLSLYESGDNIPEDTSDEKPDDKELVRRGNIKFTIWEEPDKKVKWITDNNKFQKIEYKYEDKEKNIYIDF